jgi:hypothetical protein
MGDMIIQARIDRVEESGYLSIFKFQPVLLAGILQNHRALFNADKPVSLNRIPLPESSIINPCNTAFRLMRPEDGLNSQLIIFQG